MTNMQRTGTFCVVIVGLLVVPAALGDAAISKAWVRAMPPGQTMTAGYLTLENTGTSAITVTGARSDASPRVEIHTTVSLDGMQRMQSVDSLEVPAGARIDMAPGGYHLMLRDMPVMPAEGDSVELCLELDTEQAVCATAKVSRGAPGTNSHHDH